MSNDHEPRDEREFKAELELSTGPIGGKIALMYRRLWDRRVDELAADVIDLAGIDESEFAARLEAGDQVSDMFKVAAERVIADGDPFLRDVLARLVAAALDDDARIHEASYLMDRLKDLHPLHIRVVWVTPVYDKVSKAKREVERTIEEANPGAAAQSIGDQAISYARHEQDKYLPGSSYVIAYAVRSSHTLVTASLRYLTTTSFVDGSDVLGVMQYWLTELGASLVELVGDIHEKNKDFSPDRT